MVTEPRQAKIDVSVLIVEDSMTQAERLQYILEREGYCVSSSKKGKEALLSIRENRPTLVIEAAIQKNQELTEEITMDPPALKYRRAGEGK